MKNNENLHIHFYKEVLEKVMPLKQHRDMVYLNILSEKPKRFMEKIKKI